VFESDQSCVKEAYAPGYRYCSNHKKVTSTKQQSLEECQALCNGCYAVTYYSGTYSSSYFQKCIVFETQEQCGKLIDYKDTKGYDGNTYVCQASPGRPCQDVADFKDDDGHTCHDYIHRLHACTGSGTWGGKPMNGGGGWKTSEFRKHKNSQGMSADMACCACGGGDRGSCTDTPDWVDEDGHDCPFYTDTLHACTGYGPNTPSWDFWMFRKYVAKDSIGADFACCGCGGGTRNMVCTDLLVNGKPWKSKDGDDCAAHAWDYKYHMCTGNGPNTHLFKPEYFRKQDTRSPRGFGALEVCCVCGGGNRTYK